MVTYYCSGKDSLGVGFNCTVKYFKVHYSSTTVQMKINCGVFSFSVQFLSIKLGLSKLISSETFKSKVIWYILCHFLLFCNNCLIFLYPWVIGFQNLQCETMQLEVYLLVF